MTCDLGLWRIRRWISNHDRRTVLWLVYFNGWVHLTLLNWGMEIGVWTIALSAILVNV